MNKEEGGGPAFPTVARDGNWQPHHDGMSLRDWFAGQATARVSIGDLSPESAMEVAHNAYQLADAMLKERAK